MDFIEKINNLTKKYKKIAIFFDMDGVMVEYNIDDTYKLKNNIPGVYINKKPINYIIDKINQLLKNEKITIYILTSCGYFNQAKEKEEWLDKYLKEIPKENRIYVVKEDQNIRKLDKRTSKGYFINEELKKHNYDITILIDDTHLLLEGAKEILEDKIIALHISSMIT